MVSAAMASVEEVSNQGTPDSGCAQCRLAKRSVFINHHLLIRTRQTPLHKLLALWTASTACLTGAGITETSTQQVVRVVSDCLQKLDSYVSSFAVAEGQCGQAQMER